MLLALGNAMNETEIRGFTLGSLQKIADTRSTVRSGGAGGRAAGGSGGSGANAMVVTLLARLLRRDGYTS